MDKNAELGEFLRASRARLRPHDVGLLAEEALAARSPRRVRGLRREEVAGLAGVSVDYYARLEQGRVGQVSPSVLTAIATTLRLNEAEQEYFFTLVSGPPHPSPRSTAEIPQRVRPSVHRLLALVTDSPALVLGRGMQLLAMNRLARTVLFDLESVPAQDRNLAKWIFLAAEARTRYLDWEDVASEAVAVLRCEAGAPEGSPSAEALALLASWNADPMAGVAPQLPPEAADHTGEQN